MKKQTAFFIVFVVLSISSVLFAQKNIVPYDHLEPTRDILSGFELGVSYYQKLRRVLLDHEKTPFLVRFVCLPSFTPEWVVDVTYDSVIYTAAKQHIFHTEKEPIELTVEKAPISKETTTLLEQVWKKSLLKVRYPKTPHHGKDGTRYYFSMFLRGHGRPSGTTWSPKTKRLSKLVEIGTLLKNLALSQENEREEWEKSIQKECKKLLKRS